MGTKLKPTAFDRVYLSARPPQPNNTLNLPFLVAETRTPGQTEEWACQSLAKEQSPFVHTCPSNGGRGRPHGTRQPKIKRVLYTESVYNGTVT